MKNGKKQTVEISFLFKKKKKILIIMAESRKIIIITKGINLMKRDEVDSVKFNCTRRELKVSSL